MRVLGNTKTDLDDFYRMLFASTYSMCPSTGMVCADAIRLKQKSLHDLLVYHYEAKEVLNAYIRVNPFFNHMKVWQHIV